MNNVNACLLSLLYFLKYIYIKLYIYNCINMKSIVFLNDNCTKRERTFSTGRNIVTVAVSRFYPE